MAHISNKSEYALHCLLYLVHPPNDTAPSARDLAEFQGVSAPYLAKLFTKLQKAGLVTAAQGVRGGFQLARAAADIRVLDVIDAVEGKNPLFDCKQIRGNCILITTPAQAKTANHGVCTIHALMLKAETAMRQTLADQTLADIAGTVADKIPDHQRNATTQWFADRTAGRSPGRRPRSNSSTST